MAHPGGRAAGGEDGEASGPGCMEKRSLRTGGSFFQVCLHLLMGCLSMEKTVKLSNSELPR